KQDNAFLGIYFAGLALLVIGAALVVFSRLLPVSARIPLPDILTPGLFAVLGFVPALVLAFLLAALSGALVALIRSPLSASAQKAVDDISSLGPILIAVVLTLLI